MKISLKKLRLLNKVYLEDFTGEISVKEIIELLTFAEKGEERAEEVKSEPFNYSVSGEPIRFGDEAFIIQSEDCVTNSDTIRYDEKVSGFRVKVLGFDQSRNMVLVKIIVAKPGIYYSQSPFNVHPHWLVNAKL